MHKIFLAEDDSTLKTLLKTLLELEGFEVVAVAVSTREDVFDQIIHFQPEIILLDVNLRQTNGIEILNLVRSDPRISSSRVLMTSGEECSDICRQNGADGFLLKPYMPDQLLGWIRTHLSDHN